MPTIAPITVKKYDGTTDVVYVPTASASADGTPAVFVNSTGYAIPATRPTFRISTRNNGKGTARRVTSSYKLPLTATDSNGRLVINGSVNGEFSMVLPQDVDPLIVREAHQQFVKLLSSTLIRDSMDAGFAPR